MGPAKNDGIDELSLKKQDFRYIWPWAPGLKCPSNNEAELIWLVLWGAFCSEAGVFTWVWALVIWRSPLNMPSFTAVSCARCVSWLHDLHLRWKVFCPRSQFHLCQCGTITETGRALCAFALSRNYASHGVDKTGISLSWDVLLKWTLSLSTNLWLKSEQKVCDSLHQKVGGSFVLSTNERCLLSVVVGCYLGKITLGF